MNTTPRAEVAQITALIERAKEQRDRDAAEHCPAEIIALQDEVIAGLEALEAENLGLRLECQGLKAEVAEVKSFWKEAQLRNRNLLEERDALAAELATLKAQEPVGTVSINHQGAWASLKCPLKEGDALYAAPKALEPVVKVVVTMHGIFPTWFNGDWHRQNYRPTDLREDKQISLYAAPKALEPLTEQTLWDLFYASAQKHGFTTHAQYTSFARAIEAAHGITKGTP